MAMGNFCQIKNIECCNANVLGACKNDIFDDYGLCEMEGYSIGRLSALVECLNMAKDALSYNCNPASYAEEILQRYKDGERKGGQTEVLCRLITKLEPMVKKEANSTKYDL